MSAETEEFDSVLQGEEAEFDKIISPEYSFSKSAGNILPDLLEYGKETFEMYSNPVKTMQNIGNLGGGVISKAIPGYQDIEKYADAAGEYYSDRYGSMDKYKRYAEKEPVHALSDISLVGGLLRGLPGGAGKAANIISMADPAALAVAGGGKALGALGKLPKGVSDSALRSTVKFPPASIKDRTKRAKMYETMHQNDIIASPEGMEKLNDSLAYMNNTVATRTNKLDDFYGEVPLSRIDDSVQKLIEQRSSGKGTVPDKQRDIAAIQRIYDRWRVDVPESGKMTPTNLLDLKRNFYDEINYSPTRRTNYNPSDEARRAIGRGAKEILEDLDPEIKGINQKFGDLMELKDPLMQATNRLENNNNAFRMQHLIGAGIGASVGGAFGAPGVGSTAGVMASGMLTPERLQKIAMSTRRGGEGLNKQASALNAASRGLLTNKDIWNKGVDLNRALVEMQPYLED